jgi:hypothetical protein
LTAGRSDVGTRYSTCFTVFLAVAAWAALPVAAQRADHVLVLLQNDAGVQRDLAARAQSEVVRLYSRIGDEVAWVTDVPESGRRVRVVSLVTWEPAETAMPASVLGVTYGDQGRRGYRAYVFWRRVERASQKFTAPEYNLLAVAIAHELGHMLMPDGSHAKRGLMAAPWNSADFRSASAGLLNFSPESAALIRRELTNAITVARRADR